MILRPQHLRFSETCSYNNFADNLIIGYWNGKHNQVANQWDNYRKVERPHYARMWKIYELNEELNRSRWDILGFCEVRRVGFGEISKEKGHKIWFSGKERKHQLARASSNRICAASFRNMTMIPILQYSPDSNNENSLLSLFPNLPCGRHWGAPSPTVMDTNNTVVKTSTISASFIICKIMKQNFKNNMLWMQVWVRNPISAKNIIICRYCSSRLTPSPWDSGWQWTKSQSNVHAFPVLLWNGMNRPSMSCIFTTFRIKQGHPFYRRMKARLPGGTLPIRCVTDSCHGNLIKNIIVPTVINQSNQASGFRVETRKRSA